MKDAESPALRFWLAKKSIEGRDMKKAEALIEAAFNLAHKPSGRAELQSGRAALRAAFGQGFRVRRGDVLKTLLASAIFFSNEATKKGN